MAVEIVNYGYDHVQPRHVVIDLVINDVKEDLKNSYPRINKVRNRRITRLANRRLLQNLGQLANYAIGIDNWSFALENVTFNTNRRSGQQGK